MNFLITSISTLVAPFILVFAIYVQMNGKYSPGGGFQAGIILTSIMASLSLAEKYRNILNIFNKRRLITVACLGCLLYCFVGLASIFLELNYMNHYFISKILNISKTSSQSACIAIIEVSIGVTVFAVMYLIFLIFENA